MGYSFDMRGRLVCDHCGRSGGVRRRKCKYMVTDWTSGVRLPYCPSPALCSACYADMGGLNGVHGESCRAGATMAQRQYDEEHTRLSAGDSIVRAAWGDWHALVPPTMVGVLFKDLDGVERYRLVPKAEYDHTRKWLTEFTDVHEWCGPMGNR